LLKSNGALFDIFPCSHTNLTHTTITPHTQHHHTSPHTHPPHFTLPGIVTYDPAAGLYKPDGRTLMDLGGKTAGLTTLQGQDMAVSLDGDRVYVDDAKCLTYDIEADNGTRLL
jgi:hypothetical protein